MDNLKHIIECLLFVAEEPLTIERILKIILSANADEIRNALKELADEYETRKGGFYLNEVAGGYQIRTRSEYTQWIKRLIQPKQPRLSKASLETLAIIAYKQPIIRSDIEHLRGVDCDGILRTLLERKLIRILGRKELPGRPMIYGTTRYFLEVFDLKDLTDLPTPEEIKDLGSAASDQIALPSESAESEKPLKENTTPTADGQPPNTSKSEQNKPVH
jgi:segregation and condensation protein B